MSKKLLWGQLDINVTKTPVQKVGSDQHTNTPENGQAVAGVGFKAEMLALNHSEQKCEDDSRQHHKDQCTFMRRSARPCATICVHALQCAPMCLLVQPNQSVTKADYVSAIKCFLILFLTLHVAEFTLLHVTFYAVCIFSILLENQKKHSQSSAVNGQS